MNAPRQLHTVEFRLELPTRPGVRVLNGLAVGHSTNKRRPLWTEANVWTNADADLDVEPADWVHHIALCALQDRPTDAASLLMSLTGGEGEQLNLF